MLPCDVKAIYSEACPKERPRNNLRFVLCEIGDMIMAFSSVTTMLTKTKLAVIYYRVRWRNLDVKEGLKLSGI